MAKTAEEIRSSLKKSIVYENPNIDVESGSVASDLGINAFSDELASVYTEQDRNKKLYMMDASSFSAEEADNLAASYGLYRLEATKATGEVIFCASKLPDSGSQYTIPVGTLVSTSGDTDGAKQYITVTTGVINQSTVLNPKTNYYEANVTVQAVSAGTSGNVAAGTINRILSGISGSTAVYNNNSIVNGTEQETTEELIARVKLKLRGFVYGTKASYEAKVYEDPRVLDCVVVDPDNKYSVRGPGSIDLYVLGSEPATYSQTVTDPASNQSVRLERGPYITGTTMYVELPDGSQVDDSHFTVERDETTVYAGSYIANDRLVWNTDYFNSTVVNFQYYVIVYTYNKLIGDIQDTFTSSDYRIITSNVLVKRTEQIDVKMDFDIVTLPGYDGTSVRNTVLYNIQAFINNFTLDRTLRQSDIIGIVEGVAGVDYVKLPMRSFCLVGENTVKDVESSPLEYIRIDANNILIG